MKLYALLIIGCAMSVLGCAEKAPEPTDRVGESAAAPEAEAPATETGRDEAFLNHMHWHAEKLDELNFALADGDLEGAGTPAYWLSRHDQVEGIPAEFQPFLAGMRSAAMAVEGAEDLDTARTAAELINEQCQGCHAAAGVEGG